MILRDADQLRFDRLRTAHFPPERLVVGAHVTLFHHLPGAQAGAIGEELAARCRAAAGFTVAVTEVRSLGRGVAFGLASPELERLRSELAQSWAGWLGAQDRQRFRPHVTVQNKVEPSAARALLAQLQAEFVPFRVGAEGLALWRYRGGPWERVAVFEFGPGRV
ncbi:MAG: 2'-5' RNA ligase family protein [Acetobacteraceae bacterium]